MNRTILILGAVSAIAQGAALRFAQQGDHLFLAGRKQDELNHIADDLTTRFHIKVHTGFFDALDFDSHKTFFAHVLEKFPKLDGVVVAFGYLTDPKSADEFAECKKVIDSNFTGTVSIINICVDYFIQQKSGFIIGISSVAGETARKSHYIYSASKAALSLYLQGLRQRLFRKGIRIITIKPGYVDTPMTSGRTDIFLVADPKKVGKIIADSLKNSRRDILYIPWFWRYLMLILRLIPESIHKRLSL